MTYILGWKTESSVYIAADSMITGHDPALSNESSFGEKHIVEKGIAVSERALKIHVADDLVIAMAGDVGRAREAIRTVFRCYKSCQDAPSALNQMIVSHVPFDETYDVVLLVAWRTKPVPRLFAFNNDGKHQIFEVNANSIIQAGSVDAGIKRTTAAIVGTQLFKLESESPMAHLASVLGLLQIYGIHEYLLPSGVGGSFAGAMISADKIEWQPDLLYLIHQPRAEVQECVGTFIRDNALVVTSQIARDCRIFANSLDGEFDLSSWNKKWESLAMQYIGRREFDYVTLLDMRRRVIAVIETKKQRRSKFLKFGDEPTGIGTLRIHESVLKFIEKPVAQNPGETIYGMAYWRHEAEA